MNGHRRHRLGRGCGGDRTAAVRIDEHARRPVERQ